MPTPKTEHRAGIDPWHRADGLPFLCSYKCLIGKSPLKMLKLTKFLEPCFSAARCPLPLIQRGFSTRKGSSWPLPTLTLAPGEVWWPYRSMPIWPARRHTQHLTNLLVKFSLNWTVRVGTPALDLRSWTYLVPTYVPPGVSLWKFKTPLKNLRYCNLQYCSVILPNVRYSFASMSMRTE